MYISQYYKSQYYNPTVIYKQVYVCVPFNPQHQVSSLHLARIAVFEESRQKREKIFPKFRQSGAPRDRCSYH